MSNEIHRKSFPRVREVIKEGVTRYVCDSRRRGYAGGRQEWFSSKDDALERAREIADALVGGNVLTDEERSLFIYYRDALRPLGVTMEQALKKALDRAQNKLERDEDEKKTVADLVDLWISYKKDAKFSALRPVTIREIEHTGKKIKELWGDLQYQSVTRDHVETFLGGHLGCYATKKNWQVKIGGFFNWCNAEGWGRGNPAKHIRITVDPSEAPGTVPLEKVQALLEQAQKNPRWLPLINYLAIGFFAGLRPYELRRLPKRNIELWSALQDGKRGQIYVSASMTKTKTERYVTINATLAPFLEVYLDKEPIFHQNFVKLFDSLRQKVGYAFGPEATDETRWVPDGIRHTFGSMWQMKHKNISELAEEMGNSPEVIRRHYKRAIRDKEVSAFWGIRPLSAKAF
jgi:integrase